MFKKFLITAVLLVISLSVGAKPTEEDKNFCYALSTYAQALVINKVHSNVSREQAWDYLVNQQLAANNLIAYSLTEPIKHIIGAIYSEEHPPIVSGADIAKIVTDVNKECLRASFDG